MRSILFVLLSLIPIAFALDCRKFSFAPACRGIMLKRSDAPEQEQSSEIYQLTQNLETLTSLLRQAEADGIKELGGKLTYETTLHHAPASHSIMILK
ncbi:unnamed protein product [Cylicocyclus nassatus]|uniref:Uncharacterized protein n=1 Tax=Cylicocyclus nassatus TaxID=53992 RepID=A0AA36HFP4_CYLNA|nr:unnamed protein product [Cylicocyclus nassatus]